jgi:hypothetical protein
MFLDLSAFVRWRCIRLFGMLEIEIRDILDKFGYYEFKPTDMVSIAN